MLLQSQIAEVIQSQAANFLGKHTGLEREILPQLPVPNRHTLIITGIRRCGKSTLLLQLLKNCFDTAFYLHFEDPRLAGFEKNDFARLESEIKKRKPEVLFFDEIQIMDQWEFFIRHLLDQHYKIVITGSNATLLSRELGTRLTGRHLSVELFPFSYNEFLAFKKLKNTIGSSRQYLLQGGFPEYIKAANGFILNQLLEDILYRDIAVRYGVRDVRSLKQLAVYLISNIGKPVSANNLKSLFAIKATSTILEYFSYLENAYIVQFLPMFSHSVKKQVRNMKKVYTIDPGMFTENSIVFTDENGRSLENAVYLHLRRKYKELYYFTEKGECDFIAMEKGRPKEVIQACYELNADNLERETAGLTTALDFFNIKKGKIVTVNQTDTINNNGKSIEVVSLADFLTDQ
ncbi:AAA family ATPase [Niabella ginsenosidivorans]|uniref:AAA family ATPase n=1 Tax=Niabella ginsenosidivorans TaxID=1176587 RepID=A0A1A9HWB5_9BACT|nr:ATP-binding protein [Niabella ginsenosidivorans]ANH79698.1 AAA family ATPase [Niabella ginsenosidivorans]